MQFPEIVLAADEPLDEAFRYVVSRFSDQGFPVQTLEEITAQLPCADQISLFTVSGTRDLHLFVVVTREWDEPLVLTTLESLLSLRQAAPTLRLTVRFIAAHPLPSLLAYVFEDSMRGQLESEAILEVRFDFDTPMHLERPVYLARQIQRWLQDFGHRTLYPDQLETIAWINRFVLEELRQPVIIDDEPYEPLNSLICLGCLVGEVLAHQPQLQARWVSSEVLGGAALEVCPRMARSERSWWSWREPEPPAPAIEWEKAVAFNPIGRVIQLFREGETEDLMVFVERVLSYWDV